MTPWHTNPSKFDLVLNIKNRVKFRKICIESLQLYLGSNFIFTTKVLHLASLWRWGFLKLGNGLFNSWKTKFQYKLKERLLKLKRWHHFREKLSLPPSYCILNSLASHGVGEKEKRDGGVLGTAFFSPPPPPPPPLFAPATQAAII